MHDNKVSIKFFPNSFSIKFLAKEIMVLQRGTEGDFYKFPLYCSSNAGISINSIVFNKSLVKSASWHDRLGYPHCVVVE